MNDMRQFEFAASAQQALRECEERFRSLLDLSSDWYWEQDDQFRFTQFMGGVFEKSGIDVRQYLGRTRWEAGGLPMHADNWDDHLALLGRQPVDRGVVVLQDEKLVEHGHGEDLTHLTVKGDTPARTSPVR